MLCIISWQCHTFNLNIHTLWQLLDSYTAPGWFMSYILLILPIHFCEVVHVCQENLDFDDPFEWWASFGEDCWESFQTSFSSFGHCAFDDVAVFICWQLSTAINCMRCLDCLGLSCVSSGVRMDSSVQKGSRMVQQLYFELDMTFWGTKFTYEALHSYLILESYRTFFVIELEKL